jgi:hypothetical protein
MKCLECGSGQKRRIRCKVCKLPLCSYCYAFTHRYCKRPDETLAMRKKDRPKPHAALVQSTD